MAIICFFSCISFSNAIPLQFCPVEVLRVLGCHEIQGLCVSDDCDDIL